MNWEKITLGSLSTVGGAIVLAIVGFNWGGWVTGGTAQKMAEETAEDAVVNPLAPICVEQFNQDSEKQEKLEELKEKSVWDRDDYVEKQGWATMPGEKTPDSKVADKCADMLIEASK